MITLLLAEDEFYTRKGLLKHLDFAAIGIDRVLEAEDGRAGLLLAHNNKIDILLTDVKMPHADGIELAKNVRILYPECIILFLSGYSDRDYLRSALSLRTFRYIDKPVDTGSLTEALRDAVRLYRRLESSSHYNLAETRKAFARSLVMHSDDAADHSGQMQLLGISPDAFFDCRTVLVQLLNNCTIQASTDFSPSLFAACECCTRFFDEYKQPALISEFKERYILIHLLSSDQLLSEYKPGYLNRLLRTLSRSLEKYPHFIAVGELVHSVYALKESYNSAVIALQSNFYLGVNSISGMEEGGGAPGPGTGTKNISQSYEMPQETCQAIQQSVINHDPVKCIGILNHLYAQYRAHPASLVSNTKAGYHQLLYWLFQYKNSRQRGKNEPSGSNAPLGGDRLTNEQLIFNESYLLEKITASSTLDDLHLFAVHCFEACFMENPFSTDSNVANQIMHIISQEYSNPGLGIQYLCDRCGLSSSHLCYLFKRATGETINQYIQNVRVEAAQRLLADTDLKISDIAVRCGCPDSNYFAKMFRKKTGFLPSEYREVHSI